MISSPKTFGIIRTLPDGTPEWVEALEDLAEAKAYVISLATEEPGEFFIYCETSGIIVERFVCVEDLGDDRQPVGKFESHAQRPRFLN